MHMSDALLVPAVGATMYLCSAVTAHRSISNINLKEDYKRLPMMGVAGAFVFAAQMVNFTIPGTGASGHICGSILLTAILGPYAAFITMIGILMIQALMFADGGILALGCNIWNMAFYGCFLGGFMIWKPMMKRGITKKKIATASILASILTLQLGAFSVVVETTLSGITDLPFIQFAAMMQPIHLVIGLLEGLITGSVLLYLYETKPELLWMDESVSRGSSKKILVIIFSAAIIVSGLFSLLASGNPDGLEWAIERTASGSDLQSVSLFHQILSQMQARTALLADYGVAGNSDQFGTIISGLTGVLLLAAAGAVAGSLIRRFGKKKEYES